MEEWKGIIMFVQSQCHMAEKGIIRALIDEVPDTRLAHLEHARDCLARARSLVTDAIVSPGREVW